MQAHALSYRRAGHLCSVERSMALPPLDRTALLSPTLATTTLSRLTSTTVAVLPQDCSCSFSPLSSTAESQALKSCSSTVAALFGELFELFAHVQQHLLEAGRSAALCCAVVLSVTIPHDTVMVWCGGEKVCQAGL